LFKGNEHHGRPIGHDEARIILTGFNIKDLVIVHFYIPAVLPDKEKRLHVVLVLLQKGDDKKKGMASPGIGGERLHQEHIIDAFVGKDLRWIVRTQRVAI
jgi:hypothetical protein